MVWLAALALVLALWPWRFSLLVRWGSDASWEASFWSWRLGGGRLRDLSLPKGRKKAEKPDTEPSRRRRKPFSLQRMALRAWKDRRELWTLMRFSNRSTVDVLDMLTRRFTIVLAGLDPSDQGWLSVLDSMRQGAGWLRKVRVLNDWNPEASGGAVRWDLGFCVAEIAWCLGRILVRAPWRIFWKIFRGSGKESEPALP